MISATLILPSSLKDYDLSQVLSRCLHFRAGMVNNFLPPIAHAQGANKPLPETPIKDADADHEEQRSEWFLRGRVVPGKSSAELHRRAYQTKMQGRATRLGRISASQPAPMVLPVSGRRTPFGPVPLASDATGTGCRDHHLVSGRARNCD